MKRFQPDKIIIMVIGILIGSIFISPVEAKVATVTMSWLRKNYYTKKQANARYYSKTAVNSKLTGYYNKSSVNNLLSDYLKTIDATTGYLTKNDASSTYLPLSGGTMTGYLTTPGYFFSSPESKAISIPASAFVPESSSIVLQINTADDSLYKVSGAAENAIASVILPQGAVITGVREYYYDTDAQDVRVNLYADDLSSASSTLIGGAVSSGSAGYGSAAQSINDTIDNTTRNYNLFANFKASGTTLRLKGVKISYTIDLL